MGTCELSTKLRAILSQVFRGKSRLHCRASEIRLVVNTQSAAATLPSGGSLWGALQNRTGLSPERRHIRVPTARGIRSPRSKDSAAGAFRENPAVSTNWNSRGYFWGERRSSSGSRGGLGLRLPSLGARETIRAPYFADVVREGLMPIIRFVTNRRSATARSARTGPTVSKSAGGIITQPLPNQYQLTRPGLISLIIAGFFATNAGYVWGENAGGPAICGPFRRGFLCAGLGLNLPGRHEPI